MARRSRLRRIWNAAWPVIRQTAENARFRAEALESRCMLSAGWAPQHWSIATALDNAIVYDNSGILHMAYYDTADQHLKYASRSLQGTWSATAVVDASAGTGTYPSIAIDPQTSFPAISYYDATNKDL